MRPVEFAQQTIEFAKDQPEYGTLPAYIDPTDSHGEVITCWELTDEDIAILKETKRLWVSSLTFRGPLQPQLISAHTPDKFQAQMN